MYPQSSVVRLSARRVFLGSSAVAVLLLAACADLRWEKPGADSIALERDLELCTQKARLEARREEVPRLDGPLLIRPDPQGRPIVVPSVAASRDSERFLVEHDFTATCMRGKGYVQVPAEKIRVSGKQ